MDRKGYQREALIVADALDKTRKFVLGCENLIIAVDHTPLLHHRLSWVAFTNSNCRAEIGVKTMKRLIADYTGPKGELDTDAVQIPILQYRNTPDPDTRSLRHCVSSAARHAILSRLSTGNTDYMRIGVRHSKQGRTP